jgi:hypothetical protein
MNLRRFMSDPPAIAAGRFTARSNWHRAAGKSLGNCSESQVLANPLMCLQPDQDTTWRAAQRHVEEGCTTIPRTQREPRQLYDTLLVRSGQRFQQCTEFPLLRNRSLGPLAVTVLSIPLARRAAATACAAVQSTTPLFRRWRRARLSAIGPRSVTLTAGYVRPCVTVGFGCKLKELHVEHTGPPDGTDSSFGLSSDLEAEQS